MFVVQMRHKGKIHEVWDETIHLETLSDAEEHIKGGRSGIPGLVEPFHDDRYEYRIVQIIKDFH